MNTDNADKKKQIIAALVVLVVVVLIVAGSKMLGSKEDKQQAANTSTSSNNSNTETQTSANTDFNATYNDGSYEATGSYVSPGGTQSIKLSVTLKDNVVVSTEAESGAVDSESKEFQAKFLSGYKAMVVGKDINSISLSRVSGSSLTSQGFNNAIEQIKTEAKS
jgi:uncharacterized protein with FMN-binding domain